MRKLKTSRLLFIVGMMMLCCLLFNLPCMAEDWNSGDLKHLIPAANQNRFLIKTSFEKARKNPPVLLVNKMKFIGSQTGPEGKFWQFDASGLSPDTEYKLQLTENDGKTITDPWNLKTLPAPDAKKKTLRILAFTCAGGWDGPTIGGRTTWLDMDARKRLLAKGMSYDPDLVISNGDHVYWDIKTFMNKPEEWAKVIKENYWEPFGGEFDLDLPMTDPANYQIFKKVVDAQIPALYGVTLRSTPSYFLTDDHDMFENDEFDDDLATLPADSYGIFAGNLTQLMYYPEFLPNDTQPDYLEGTGMVGRAEDVNMFFGTLRYGTLLEADFFDCRRYVDYKGDHARIIPQWVEKWLVDRMEAEDTANYFLVPSLPFGYSSGKLGDWYPDVLDEETGKLVLTKEKQGYQQGWFNQHQRLLKAISEQTERQPIIIEGDFHASSAGKITKSGDMTLTNPVHTILTGTLGTGDMPFPSFYRDMDTSPSGMLEMDETMSPVEKNGFTVIDITEDEVIFRMFTWRPPQSPDEIDTMEPVLEYVVKK